MTLLLDTSGILAALFEDQRHHEECAQVLRDTEGPLIVSPFVLAEASAIIRRHAGAAAELMFLEEVERGAFQLAPFEQTEVMAARQIVARHKVGLPTASLFVLADRYACRRVLTLHPDSYPKRFRSLPDL